MVANVSDTGESWNDPDDAPEWPDEVFGRAEIRDGDRLVRAATGTLTRKGRPRLSEPKKQVTMRLDGAVLDRLRASGPGWQSRVNAILRKALKV